MVIGWWSVVGGGRSLGSRWGLMGDRWWWMQKSVDLSLWWVVIVVVGGVGWWWGVLVVGVGG